MKINKRLIKRILKGLLFFVGANLAYVVLCFLTYPTFLFIYDPFMPHPMRDHGTKPEQFEGLWVQWDADPDGEPSMAFHLNGDVSDLPTMAQRRWHFDNGLLYIDSYSGCGNDIPFARTSKYKVEFDGPSRMQLAIISENWLDYSGWYERVEADNDLRQSLEAKRSAGYDDESWRAHRVLLTISHAEDRGHSLSTHDN